MNQLLPCLLALICFSMSNRLFAVTAKLFLDEPLQLQTLEANGFGFGQLALGITEFSPNNAAMFNKSEKFRFLADTLGADFAALKKADKTLSTSMASSHRLFDLRWLQSTDAWFELVAVVNRMDRSPFKPKSCGEIRMIYRLAYRKQNPKIYSRLPMTINVVYWNDGKDECAVSVKAWESFLAVLDSTPTKLRPADLGLVPSMLKSIEVNLQSVRWPATVRPDMGGYAEYLLRVFKPSGRTLQIATLENTPDVDRINKNLSLKKKLLAWLLDDANLKQVDEGVVNLPEEFLANKATSVALQGTHRLANAPYTQLITTNELTDINFSSRKTFKSPRGLLRRLNDFSCVGCHQGRTVAGFHLLGKDREDTDPVNAIYVSSSPHFFSDQARRQAFFASVKSKKSPQAFRPISVRADDDGGNFGTHCGLGDPTYDTWTCAKGLVCKTLMDDKQVSQTGVCEPGTAIAGSSCQPGKIKHHNHPHVDRIVLGEATSCQPRSVCESTSVGFPGGMCSGPCTSLKNDEVCGSIAILQGFNDCLARGKTLFSQCLANNIRPAALKRCSDAEACRDDFICARTASKEGACIPPYFLFQLRLDGHPKP